MTKTSLPATKVPANDPLVVQLDQQIVALIRAKEHFAMGFAELDACPMFLEQYDLRISLVARQPADASSESQS